MSLSSAYPDPPGLRRAYWKQLQRIKNDELMETREQTVKETNTTNLTAKWRETLDETAAYRKLKRQNNEMAEEFRLSSKEMIAVIAIQYEFEVINGATCLTPQIEVFTEGTALAFHECITKLSVFEFG